MPPIMVTDGDGSYKVSLKSARRAKKGKVNARKPIPAHLKRLERKVARIDKMIELKYSDELNTNAGSAITSAGYGATLNNFPEGLDEAGNRIGDKIHLTSLQLKYSMFTSNTCTQPPILRIIIGLDRAPYGAGIPALTGAVNTAILDSSIIGDLTLAPRCYQARDRYKILYDKCHVLTPPAMYANNVTNIVATQHRVKNIRLNHEVTYKGTTGATTDINRNLLFMYVVASPGTTGTAFINAGTRLYFKDA